MLQAIMRFNGYTVAIACFQYCLTRMLESEVGGFMRSVGLGFFLDDSRDPHWIFYVALMAASIVLILGFYWERKRLVIPFVIAYTAVLYSETGGSFRAARVWEALFTFYVVIVVLSFLLVGICPCCPRKDGRKRRGETADKCCV